jgi:uroporphyrinogen-III decarboxylase
MGQVKGHPLAELDLIDTYKWPNPDNPSFYSGLDKMISETGGKYVLSGIFMLLFERIHALRGFENTLVDLLERPGLFQRIADHVEAFAIGAIKNLAGRFGKAIHGFTFTDDWGTERNLLIHPDVWRDRFKPRYKRIFKALHDNGWHVWMHSCGKINEIIDDLIEIGLDVINVQQPRVLGIKDIGKRFKGRICFETLCDIQKTLPMGSVDDIRTEARELIHQWAAPNGGLIVSDYGDSEAIGVAPEIKRSMLESFLEIDPWKGKQSKAGGR